MNIISSHKSKQWRLGLGPFDYLSNPSLFPKVTTVCNLASIQHKFFQNVSLHLLQIYVPVENM